MLVFDEINALIANSLISVLNQLRAGFPDRPAPAPSSVILCGMRDVRDPDGRGARPVTRMSPARSRTYC